MKFVGPGLMVSVAYMDPGNYSTAVAAGSAYQYKLLFSILLLNCLGVFLQVLSAKLGAVTGLDLAANCKEHLPPRINIFVYVLAEISIIATDLAEVVGTAIALNILFNLPLFVGVIVTVVDVIVVLMAYRPNGPLLFVRIFESFVSVLVAATVVCFGIELAQVAKQPNFSIAEVMKGFLPNPKIVDTSEREGGNGLFLSLAILGATVMPHSLYLGSGLVQARLKDFDIKYGHYVPEQDNSVGLLREDDSDVDNTQLSPDSSADFSHDDFVDRINKKQQDQEPYRPSIHAIDDTMSYTIVELVISLFTVALFVNSAILIVAGATMGLRNDKRDSDQIDHDDSDDESDDEGSSANADLFTIYHLLVTHLSPTAGIVFALALLCLGQSAGVVCTLAGQMVLEGFLLWSFPPAVRRLITRGLAIAPCLLVVTLSGREGLASILNALQVVLSLLLPFVTAPLIFFTCSKKIMRVPVIHREGDDFDCYDLSDIVTGDTLCIDDLRRDRFNATEPAIRLQDIRNAHPCAGWEDEVSDESTERQNMVSQQKTKLGPNSANVTDLRESEARLLDEETSATSEPESRHILGYIDMSNGPVMSITAVLTWGFITCLNAFLLGSMFLGYDVPM